MGLHRIGNFQQIGAAIARGQRGPCRKGGTGGIHCLPQLIGAGFTHFAKYFTSGRVEHTFRAPFTGDGNAINHELSRESLCGHGIASNKK